MITYHIDIIPENEGGYFVKIREFRGCMSQGETIKETLSNIAGAMSMWVNTSENNKIPVPKAIEVNSSLAYDTSNGGYPELQKKNKRKQRNEI